MPMKTMLVEATVFIRCRPIPPAHRGAIITWPTISAAERLRTSFLGVPVWQKVQVSVQPTWGGDALAPQPCRHRGYRRTRPRHSGRSRSAISWAPSTEAWAARMSGPGKDGSAHRVFARSSLATVGHGREEVGDAIMVDPAPELGWRRIFAFFSSIGPAGDHRPAQVLAAQTYKIGTARFGLAADCGRLPDRPAHRFGRREEIEFRSAWRNICRPTGQTTILPRLSACAAQVRPLIVALGTTAL